MSWPHPFCTFYKISSSINYNNLCKLWKAIKQKYAWVDIVAIKHNAECGLMQIFCTVLHMYYVCLHLLCCAVCVIFHCLGSFQLSAHHFSFIRPKEHIPQLVSILCFTVLSTSVNAKMQDGNIRVFLWLTSRADLIHQIICMRTVNLTCWNMKSLYVHFVS